MSIKELSEIIAGCQNDDRKCQRELYDDFLPYVRAIVRRYLNDNSFFDDTVQDVFIKLFMRIKDHYSPEKGEFKPWLAKVAINLIFDFNKKNRHKTIEIEDNLSNTLKVSEEAVFKLQKEELFKLIDRMPIAYKEVFNMYVIDEFPHSEISELLNCSIDVSRQRLSRARQWLKIQLEVDHQETEI